MNVKYNPNVISSHIQLSLYSTPGGTGEHITKKFGSEVKTEGCIFKGNLTDYSNSKFQHEKLAQPVNYYDICKITLYMYI